MWIAKSDLPTNPGHPFYQRVNELLDEGKFDAFVEGQCRKFYASGVGRPSPPPGRSFGCSCSATSRASMTRMLVPGFRGDGPT